jgi:hypothetical protein
MTATPHTSRIDELLPAYALGALEGEELRELTAHLSAGDPAGPIWPICPICERELRRLAADLEQLAGAAAAPLPEALAADAPAILGGVGERLLAEVAAAPALAHRRAPAARPAVLAGRWPLLAAAAVLAVVAVWGLVRQARLGTEIERLRGERQQLAARADSLERRLAQAQAESERLARTLSIIAAPGVESVRLAGMGANHSAAGRTYVNTTDRKAVFYAFGLPALGPDKTYQLWYIDDQEHDISAGVFDVDARGKAVLVVDAALPVEHIQGWAVTIEPRGGRPQPTGPMALAG